ncbi:MAG TPA: 2OG-Fe(II) oxygenase [Gemmataceae bacterium]|nr:2OG-Fe(II) oxygenase [Gemmataceae bacterium]
MLDRFGYVIVRTPVKGGDQSVAQADSSTVRGDRPARKSYSLRAAKNEPPRRCNLFADQREQQTGLAAQKVAEFHRKGVVVLPTDSGRALYWRQTEKFDRDVGNRHSSWDWAGNSVEPYSSVLRTGIPSEELKAELLSLITSPYHESFFKGVLGCSVSIGNCRLVQSLPHATAGIGPQSWHEDGCPPGIIRGVLYLTDVRETDGPFQYKDDDATIHTVTGKTGDLLVFDAMRLPHRAMPPTSGTRMAIDLVFMPRLPESQSEVIVAGMNHWPADPFAFSIPTDKSQFRRDGFTL